MTTVEDLAVRYPETALVLPLDVTDGAAVTGAVRAAADRFGGVDVLVNNAGYGYRAAVEEGGEEDVARLFATNFHGPVALIRAVLPGMRSRRAGTIVNVSSIGARITPPGSGFYAASKAALEGMSGSLRQEVAPLGIRVIVVEPGQFRTEFAGRSLTQSAEAIADYAETAGRRRKEHDTVHGTQPGDPDTAAGATITAGAAPEPPGLLRLGEDALTMFRSVLDAERAEVEAWSDLTTTTGFREH